MPMDRSKLRAFVNKHIKWIRWAFQPQQWQVDITVEASDKDASAACETKSMYRKVDLMFDPEKTHNTEQAFSSIRHEMIHVLLAEFDLLYEAIKRVAPASELEILDVLYHNAHERAVGNIERMLDQGLGLDGMKLIERAKQVAKEQGC